MQISFYLRLSQFFLIVDSSCERVKIIADGALGSETAALSIPYKSSHGGQSVKFSNHSSHVEYSVLCLPG